MFYMKRSPAEAPYSAHIDELHEWTYHQRRHHAAVQDAVTVVDSSFPKNAGWHARDIQEHTRKFSQDQKKAEIGRDNRKIVDRLQKIAKGIQASSSRSPPPRVAGSPSRQALNPSAALHPAAEPARVGSLNEPLKRRVQRGVELENASLVRRILHTKPTFNRGREVADFARHQRTEQLLRRLPDPGWKASPQRSPVQLAPLGPPRNPEALARELESSLFLLADLRRATGTGRLALSHSASDPAVGQGALACTSSVPEGEELQQGAVAREEQIEAASPQQGPARPVLETQEARGAARKSTQPGVLGGTQRSLQSDASYRDDWDDASMTGESSSVSRTRSGFGLTGRSGRSLDAKPGTRL